MNAEYHQLSIIALDSEQQKNTCGPYKYLVRQNHGPHRGFKTRAGLVRWMEERNLTVIAIPRPIESGAWDNPRTNCCDIKGSYSERWHLDKETFYALEHVAVRTTTPNNGEYVEAIITNEDARQWCVHTLNPNVRDRLTFDYQSTDAQMS